jgi:hypothetical protein
MSLIFGSLLFCNFDYNIYNRYNEKNS